MESRQPDVEGTRHAEEAWTRLARGIEAGIVGGVVMLALLIGDSLLNGRYWWQFPNLLGSTFYGPRAFRYGAGMATLSGISLHFVITGTLGGIFGLVFAGSYRRGRMMLLGIAVSVSWYTLANALFWPRVNPWVLAASPRPATVISHVVLGACLGYVGKRGQPEPSVHSITDSPPITDPPPEILEPAFVVEPVAENEPNRDAEAFPSEHAAEPSAAQPSDAIE